MRGANLFQIVVDNFRPFVFGKGRRLSFVSLGLFAVIPLLSGLAVLHFAGPIDSKGCDVFIAVFAVVGAVLTALLAVVQNVVGAIDRSEHNAGQKIQESKKIVRLEVLRELYANIAFSVLFMVLTTVPLIVLEVRETPCVVRMIASGWVYVVSMVVFITFLHIVSGVYLILDVQAADASAELEERRKDAEHDRTD